MPDTVIVARPYAYCVQHRVCFELQTLRVIHIDVQPVIVTQIRVETVTVFRKHEYLRGLIFVKGVVRNIERYTVYRRVLQIIQYVRLIVSAHWAMLRMRGREYSRQRTPEKEEQRQR